MERSNGEIVRDLYAAWAAGDPGLELIDPEVEYVNPPDAVEPGTRRGHEAWRAAMENVRGALGRTAIDAQRLEEGEGGRVAVRVMMAVSTPTAGMETALPQSHLWTLRGGRAVRFEWFNDPERAFHLLRERTTADPG